MALRYVERNALRANLVERVQDWRWCSLWRRLNGDEESLLSAWPIDMPTDWLGQVSEAQSAAELEVLRRSENRGTPYGSDAWQMRMAKKLRAKNRCSGPTDRRDHGQSWQLASNLAELLQVAGDHRSTNLPSG